LNSRFGVAGRAPEEGERLASLLREIGLKGLTAGQYLKQVDEVQQAIVLYQAYMEGRVTYEKFMKAVRFH